jgi:hypothetical protein
MVNASKPPRILEPMSWSTLSFLKFSKARQGSEGMRGEERGRKEDKAAA